MFEQIVVGVDEHEGGRDAIALAKRLLARDGELTLAHVRAHDGDGYRGPSAAYEASGWASAAELLEKVRDEAGVEAHLRWPVSASVGRGLHELCELIGADLLAMGSSRRGMLGRVLLSDDTQAALDGAPCAIAIAPTCYSREPVAMREIGVGYDGSPESEHALELARGGSGRNRREPVRVRGRLAFDQPVRGATAPVGRLDRHAGEGSKGADRSAGLRGGSRSLRRRRRRAGAVQRVARPARRWLARLRLHRPADSRKHVQEADPQGSLPAAGAAPLRARGRSRRGGGGWSRTRGRSEGLTVSRHEHHRPDRVLSPTERTAA